MAKLRLRKNEYEGKLIVFEGTDGAGKSTLLRMTAEYLAERAGASAIVTVKQPTDLSRKTRLFQKMMYSARHDEIDYRAVQLLTMSDRVQHNREVIVPALKEGKIVLCDRYLYTSLANMLARGYTKEKWFFQACGEIVRPDLAFLAYATPDVAIRRIKARPEECDRHLDESLLRKVCGEFLKLKKTADFRIVDTERDPAAAFTDVRAALGTLGGTR